MSSFSHLKSINSSLSYLGGRFSLAETEEKSFLGLTSLEYPREDHLIFVKDKKTFEKKYQRYEKNVPDEKVSLIVAESFWQKLNEEEKKKSFLERFAIIFSSADIDESMVLLSSHFYHLFYDSLNMEVDGRQMGTCEIHPSARIAQHVFIGEHVNIEKNVIIMSGAVILPHVTIKEGSVVFPQVTIYPKVVVGKNCRLQAQSTIGSDGHGFHFMKGEHCRLWHLGGVVMGDNVEVGTSSVIDGGTFAPTFIGSGCKLDNHVQIAHNCHLGNHVMLCGQVGISGSVEIGDYSVFGGKAGVGPGVTLGKRIQAAGGALINCDWPDDSVLGGHPARPLKEWLRTVAHTRKLSLDKR